MIFKQNIYYIIKELNNMKGYLNNFKSKGKVLYESGKKWASKLNITQQNKMSK